MPANRHVKRKNVSTEAPPPCTGTTGHPGCPQLPSASGRRSNVARGHQLLGAGDDYVSKHLDDETITISPSVGDHIRCSTITETLRRRHFLTGFRLRHEKAKSEKRRQHDGGLHDLVKWGR
eukprot:GHVU01037412.1.p1 GENE.GHVU01037412.1~~GHVU01037412.1.p1  ORF type:complete len:121 (+),score=2.93 GHVU01037412.1:2-364(+)